MVPRLSESSVDIDAATIEGRRRAHWWMLAITTAMCVLLSQTEHIPGSGGLGFLTDGVTYANTVRNPAFPLSDKYYIHRALPSWVVHVGLRALGQPITDASIIGGFLTLNSLLLI